MDLGHCVIDSKLRERRREKGDNEVTHEFSYHNRLSVETSVTFSPLWMALWVSFVGIAGIYARTRADSRRTHNRRREGNIEEGWRMVVEGAELSSLGLSCA